MKIDVYELNFTKKGNDTFQNLVKAEHTINYNNLFFKIGNPKTKKFLKRFGTLYDLLLYYLTKKMNVDDVLQEQIEMSEKLKRLYYSKDLLSIEKSDLTKSEYLKYAKIFQQTQKRIQKINTIIKAFINVDNIP